jgi:2-keto-4-pentenoate hydratase/2-oxohepta-3-ene-1,7-dioic acid hydratase in catechol pathway
MNRALVQLLAAGIVSTALVTAQGITPFKLGTFERQGKTFVGIVLRDSVVVDFAAANAAIGTPASRIAAPLDMKELIARYDAGVHDRIVEAVRSAGGQSGGARPAYVYDLKELKTRPPIMYPTTMLNVAVNYTEHAVEMGLRDGTQPGAAAPPPGSAPAGTKSAPGIWGRKAEDARWNPYMFLKSPAAVIADGETIQLPLDREQIDWECELGIVIGRRTGHVPAAQAKDYIFGYTIENDVSDRGGRGDTRFGSDWLIGKSHDTFAPMGPFIIPKEFVADPQKLAIAVVVNGKPFQEGNSSQMIHDVYEQVAYASNILTLRPGDVIATGTPPGVGSARKPPVYLKGGDIVACTYEGIGTLTNRAMVQTASR